MKAEESDTFSTPIELYPVNNTEWDKEDEEKFFLADHNSLIKLEYPSLGWTKHISDTGLTKIINSFTPRELASIWLGPDRELRRIESIYYKVEALENLKRIVVPDRRSKYFRRLMNELYMQLKRDSIYAKDR